MKKKKILLATLLVTASVVSVYGEGRKLTGKVIDSMNKPVSGAVLSFAGMEGVTTEADGTFQVDLKDGVNRLSVWASGYYSTSRSIKGKDNIVITLIPEAKYRYNESLILPFRTAEGRSQGTAATNITKKDFLLGENKIDRTLSGQVAGLQVTRSSGMPGEGSYMNLRGIRSLTADNAPLIVINGIPYLTDKHESMLINGFSRNIFQTYNLNDIQNITVLKGADAALYGSLGANGVILIETDGTDMNDMETKVSFYGQYGTSWNNKRMSLLKGTEYKSYLSDIGMTYFNTMDQLFNEFPFLSSQVDPKYAYLYQRQTDWQDIVYRNAFSTDNLFRVEGGDEIAKYDLSLGYARDGGILENTATNRYHTQLNTNIMVSPKVNIGATIGLAYMNGQYQNQGMFAEYNPILASYARSPYLSPYAQDVNGSYLDTYAGYNYGKSTNADFAVSNPLAIINDLDARNTQYDVNLKVALNYKPINDLTLNATVGLYYNYNRESMFIPGMTDPCIVPVYDQYGELKNSVREGEASLLNYFVGLNGQYTKRLNDIHALNAMVGMQMMLTEKEYDSGIGRNTANDFYQTLDKVNSLGRYVQGYTEKWNWMNYYAHFDYTYNGLLKASANMSVDGSSVSGVDAARFYVYPSAGLTFMGKGLNVFSDVTWLNKLDLRAEYSMTGNSLFSSMYGRYYYTSLPYDAISGIVRANIPNSFLRPEKNNQVNIGLDLSLFQNRLDMSFDYYHNKTTDGIMPVQLQPVYGTGVYYDNVAEMSNKGFEFSVAASLVSTRDFEWVVGGNIAQNKNVIDALGGQNESIVKFADGAQLINRVGSSAYQFYGYETLGVFSTQAEADAANLSTGSGVKYKAGDMHFVDQNNDGYINEKDRVLLGDATPDFFGGFFTRFRYKNFSLSADFSYSKGNMAYNAVRRTLESVSSANNQSSAVVNRWAVEGQVTDMPRAEWGDPMDNNGFSSRWIEDASFLRMRNITLSYQFNKTFLNFFRSGTLYISAENLFTVTKYLGLDPEFSYSYADNMQGFDNAKLMQPKSVKLGINLNF